MADKVHKPKKKSPKAKSGEKGVMAALPAKRPERIGTRREAAKSPPAPKTTTATAASRTAAATSEATAPSAKPKAAAKPKDAGKPKAAGRGAATSAAGRRKAAAPRTFEPTAAAEAAAGAADERAAGAVPLADTADATEPRDAGTRYPRPRPVREGAPGIGTTGYRDRPQPTRGPGAGGGIVGSAIHAAGEVAHAGLSLGGRFVKGAVGRLPRP